MHFVFKRCNSRAKNDSFQSLLNYLLDTAPEYIKVVPSHWLEQEAPSPKIQLAISIILLTVCVTGNVSQILVVLAYTR